MDGCKFISDRLNELKQKEEEKRKAKEREEALKILFHKYGSDVRFYQQVNLLTSILYKLPEMDFKSDELEDIAVAAIHRIKEIRRAQLTPSQPV